jgi:hypothetical protein
MNPRGSNIPPFRPPSSIEAFREWWRTHMSAVIVCTVVLLAGIILYAWWQAVQPKNHSGEKGGSSSSTHTTPDSEKNSTNDSQPSGANNSDQHGQSSHDNRVRGDQPVGITPGAAPGDDTSGDSSEPGTSTHAPGVVVSSFSPNYWAQWSHGPTTDPDWFPIAVFDNDPFYNDALVKAAGINLYLGLFDFGSQYTHYVPNGLVAHNSYAMAGEALDADAILADPIGSSHIVAYQPADEPEMKHYTVSEVQAFYTDITAKDTSRPIFIGYGKGLTLPQPQSNFFLNGGSPGDYCDIPDVVAADYYGPQDSGSGPDGGWVYGRTMDLMHAACGVTKPIWNYIDTEKVNSPGDPGEDLPAPTPLEIQQHIWLSIVHGATGIIYFCHDFSDMSNPQWDTKCLVDPPRTAAITEKNVQLTKLARILNSPTRVSAVSVSNETTKLTTLTKYLNGYAYIFAMTDGDVAHPNSGSTSAKFTLDKLNNATVQVLNESRTLTASHGSFSDNFTPFQWHIYKIPM